MIINLRYIIKDPTKNITAGMKLEVPLYGQNIVKTNSKDYRINKKKQ